MLLKLHPSEVSSDRNVAWLLKPCRVGPSCFPIANDYSKITIDNSHPVAEAFETVITVEILLSVESSRQADSGYTAYEATPPTLSCQIVTRAS